MPLLILPPGRENFTTSFIRISAIADGAYGRRGLNEKDELGLLQRTEERAFLT